MVTKLSQLTSKQMDRKEFLQHAGVGLALVAGGGMIAKALGVSLPGSAEKTVQSSAQALGYGGSAYGK